MPSEKYSSELSETTPLVKPTGVKPSENSEFVNNNDIIHNKIDKLHCDNNNISATVEKPHETNDVIDQKKDKKGATLKAMFSRVSRRKKGILLLCISANFLSSCAFALIAPFYPLEAAKKGMDLTMIGFVFSLYQAVGFVASPIFGNYLNRIGAKFLYISGLFVCGVSAILFGTLDKGPGGTSFAVMCVLCRSVEAVGATAFTTASVTIVSSEFPDNIGMVLSIVNAGNAFGLMVGPVVGGVLYEWGGFGLPFYVIASLSLLNGVFIYFMLPKLQNVEHTRKKTIFNLMRSPMVSIPMMSVFVGIAGIAVYDSTFATLMIPFKLSAAIIGAFYIICSGVYALMGPVWGYLTDRKNIKAPLILVGHLIFGLGFMLSGPSPLLPFVPFKLWSVAIGFMLIGVSLGGLLLPSLTCMVQGAQELGYESNIDTYALVSGLYYSTYSLGGFVGPLAGSVIVQRYGFPNGYTIFALMSGFVMVVALVFHSVRYYSNLNRKKLDGHKEIENQGDLIVRDSNEVDLKQEHDIARTLGYISSFSGSTSIPNH